MKFSIAKEKKVTALVQKLLPFLEATPGFEPGIKDLQSHALPLGYVAKIDIEGD